MKKLAILMAITALTFVMAGCSSSASSDESALASSESASTETVVKGEIAWSDAEDEEAAGEDAGFTDGFVVPDPLPIGDYKWSKPNFTAMENVAEANYDGGDICASIRKGEGVPLKELSADLNDYKFDWTQDVDGIQVACHGYEEEVANFLEWETEGCSYNVWCVSTTDGNLGMNADEVYAMVTGIR